MPGLILIVDNGRKSPAENISLLNSMARAIAHESWHKIDTFSEPPFYVARVHLGIENAEPQPLFNEDKSMCIVMDGAVFGYDQEKQKLETSGHKFKVENDPEFCLHLYEEYGEKSIEKLNGSFVLVIYDKKHKKIVIANDRHGLSPFYYTKGDDRCIFFSEVKAILEDKTIRKKVDHQAVADFFSFGRIFGNKTFLKGINLLPPSSIVTWSKEKISEKTYWDFKFEEDGPSLSKEYYVNTLVSLFKKAVWRRTRGNHRFAVFLSGGLDSRAALGAIDKNCYPISTFTYGIRGGDEEKIAEKVAKKLGTEHEFTETRADYLVSLAEKGVFLTDGMLNCTNFYWLNVLPEARKKVDIMFHGLGLDILLSTVMTHCMFASFFGGGSEPFLERKMSKAKGDVFSDLLYKFFNSPVPEEMMPLFFSKAYYAKIKGYPRESFEKHLSTVKEKDPVNKLDSFWLRFFGRYNLSRVILRNYCEDRIPSVDNDFFEFALKVPRKFRFARQELYFRFLAKLAPDIARIQYQRTGVAPVMPILIHRIGFFTKGTYKFVARKLRAKTREILSLPEKIGYPDYGKWIRKDTHLRAFFQEVLLDNRTLSRGYFNGSYITKMVKEHMSGKKDWSTLLCALLTFELWHRLFID